MEIGFMPKPEVQNPKSDPPPPKLWRASRSPKSECRNKFSTTAGKVRLDSRSNGLIRISGFGFRSEFGDSSFGIRVEGAAEP
jgi:hypothetical protein